MCPHEKNDREAGLEAPGIATSLKLDAAAGPPLKGSETLPAGLAAVGIDETEAQQVLKQASSPKATHVVLTALRTGGKHTSVLASAVPKFTKK